MLPIRHSTLQSHGPRGFFVIRAPEARCMGRRGQMITTNLLQLVQELNAFGPVSVHDHLETIDLEMPSSVPMDQLDDLICDAIFADPLDRETKGANCVVHLAKRSNLRSASDMHLIRGLQSTGYVLEAAA
jgi:hypothetical protein